MRDDSTLTACEKRRPQPRLSADGPVPNGIDASVHAVELGGSSAFGSQLT